MASDDARTTARAVDEQRDLRNCLGHFATGVAVLSYRAADGPRGLTVNSFTAVSLDPPLVLACLDRRARAAAALPGAAFAISFLHAGQQGIAAQFAGRGGEPPPVWHDVDGVPRLADALAWLVCAPWAHQPAGDHTVIFGRITAYGARTGEPLCFYRGAFRALAPASPSAIPTRLP